MASLLKLGIYCFMVILHSFRDYTKRAEDVPIVFRDFKSDIDLQWPYILWCLIELKEECKCLVLYRFVS